MDVPLRFVVGLGNPGGRFQGTRHNVGFEVIDSLASRREMSIDRELCGALVGEREGLVLVKPMTYMNRSGFPVRCLLEREGGDPDNVMIVYDDVNLPLGRLRIRSGGSPGGHRGMESIVQNLRSPSVPRLRLGVGAPEGSAELVDHVLSSFDETEAEEARGMVSRAADAVELWLDQGIEAAMNKFNGPANDA